MNKAVIIGAGPAGLMAAIKAAEKCEVIVLEKMERPCRKLMITGKGRCNLTNNCDKETLINNVVTNSRFLYSAFSEFSAQDTMDFFTALGVPLKTERGNRVFPVSDKSLDIVDALVLKAQKMGVQIINDTPKEIIVENEKITSVITNRGQNLEANSVLIATGGASYPKTGSTGDGYKFAESLGHTIKEIKPSLVPIETLEGFCTKLAGLSLKNVKLSLFEEGKKKPVFEEMGEMLFTHFGISGPLILSASAHLKKLGKKEYEISLDLKPALSIEQLDARILRDFEECKNKDFINSLDKLLPKSMIPIVVKLSGIEAHTKINQISRDERQNLCRLLKKFPLHIKALRPIEEAIITSGGVNVKEVNPATMESKLINGLFFAGEILDVDAFTGGFNLQIAFSTGYLAGKNM